MSIILLIAALFAQSVPAVAVASAPAIEDPMSKIRCQREIETGSLVKAKKICHTRREWIRISEEAQRETQRLTKPIGNSPGN